MSATETIAPTPPRAHSPSSSELGAALGRWGLRGSALLYLGAMIALPLAAVLTKGFANGSASLRAALAAPGATAAIKLTLLTSAVAALVNALFGTMLAHALVRYRFPGRTLLSGIIDLPFAIPTLVTGVMVVAIYGPGAPIGGWLGDRGLQVAFTPLGILVALLIITLPFVVRTVQPVLAALDEAEEEAAFVLGASSWTAFRRVVLPALMPAIAAGTLLSFARAIGEFGSIVIVSANLTGRTLTAPVFIFQLASQFKPDQAAAISTVMFTFSFFLVLITYRLIGRRGEGDE
jgi:sulfate transport system permease protein